MLLTMKNIKKYLENLTNNKEVIYSLNDFYILGLNTEIGLNYFLLYKNFETRDIALNHCLKHLFKIKKCLIVDTTKF